MARTFTTKTLVILVFTTCIKLNAQQWLGRTTGNYSGTYGIYNNASSIAESKYKYYFNIWGSGENFYNNYLLYNAPIKTTQWGNGKYEPDFMDLNGKNKYYNFNRDIWGPAFMFPISKKVNMSINIRQRSSIQYFGISEAVARMGYNGIDSNSSIYSGNNSLNMNTYYHNGKFGSNMQSNRELSFSFAGILTKNEHHQLTGGATVKLIRGLGAAYLKGDGFDIAATGNNAVQLQNADIQYAYTDSRSVVEPFNKPYNLFSLQNKGYGAGVDLGLTYTYTAQKGKYATDKYCNNTAAKNDYDIKIAAAFNDIGGIRFNKDATKYNYSNANTATINVPANTFINPDYQTKNTFDTIGKYVFDPIGANKSSKFNTTLPTAFNFQADFRLANHFYTSVYLNQSLKGINSTGMKSTSLLSVIPRVETRLVEVSMPLTLSENYKNFYIGAYLRVGPVFIGSDNLGGLLKVAAKNPFRGADIYGGVSFGIDHCNKWFYEYVVEPTYIDTVKQKDTIVKKESIKSVPKDTIEIYKHDTIKIKTHDTIYINKKTDQSKKTIHDTIKLKVHDTLYIVKKTDQSVKIIHDTIYIDKIIKTKADIELENRLSKREADLLFRQKQLDERERLFNLKDKSTGNDSGAIKKCNDNNAILFAENTTLKNKVNNQLIEITKLQKQIDSLNKVIILNNNILIQAKTDKANAENNTKTITKKVDSLQNQLNSITILLNNCQKNNNVQNNNDILKLKAEKSKVENDAKAANKKADSLQAQLDNITIILSNCQKNNTSQNTVDVAKLRADKTLAEEVAKSATQKADSLQSKLNEINLLLTDCKKNSSQNDVIIVKLKKAEDDKALYKTELDALNKTNLNLNSKIYKRDATIDSLITELSKCGKNDTENKDALLIKCNDAKAAMAAEIILLKSKISTTSYSLDSTILIITNLKKNQKILEDQIIDLTSKNKSNNCDTFEMQIQQKNKTINDLKIQNTSLQTKINTLTIQFNQSKAEYQLALTQNLDCKNKLDSCMRGLFNEKSNEQTPPGIENGKSGGPMEGSTGDHREMKFDKTTYDFGSVNEGDQVKANFVLTNNGNMPITILSHSVSCGCTSPNYSKEAIRPGESTTITIEFNSAGKSGAQMKTISLQTTAGIEQLVIKGSIKEKPTEIAKTDIQKKKDISTPSNEIGLKGSVLLNVLSYIVKAAVEGGSTKNMPSETNSSLPSIFNDNTKSNTDSSPKNTPNTNSNSSTRRR